VCKNPNEEILGQPDPANTIELEIPAQVKYLGTITACVRAVLERVDCASPAGIDLMAIELAVHEACVNIIMHAYAETTGRIQMTITLSENPCRLEILLQDTGKAGSLEELAAPDPGELRERGYGLFLIKQLMDSVEYFPQNGNNRWRLVKNL
jgi:serine/threonine-protein kinase RsbW